jgi:predicted MFS family arabinose efflux permease
VEVSRIWPLYLTSFLTFAANMTLNLYIAPIVRVGTGVTGAGVAIFQSMIGSGAAAGCGWAGVRPTAGPVRPGCCRPSPCRPVAMSLHLAATHQVLPPARASRGLVMAAIFLAATALFFTSRR